MKPDAYPVCWDWPRPINSYTPDVRWRKFHGDRCALCGVHADEKPLFKDHDHLTGLMRGILCASCNTHYAERNSLLGRRYRFAPPSVLLGYEAQYPNHSKWTLSAIERLSSEFKHVGPESIEAAAEQLGWSCETPPPKVRVYLNTSERQAVLAREWLGHTKKADAVAAKIFELVTEEECRTGVGLGWQVASGLVKADDLTMRDRALMIAGSLWILENDVLAEATARG